MSNYAFDAVMPVSPSNADAASFAISKLREHTDVPFRMIVVLDGGLRTDYRMLEVVLAEGERKSWTLLHEEKRVGFTACVATGLQCTETKTALVTSSTIAVDDPRWFGKMQQIFHKDPRALVVAARPLTNNRGFHPRRETPDFNSRFFLVKTAGDGIVIGKKEPMEMVLESAIRHGGTTWHHYGVGLIEVQGEEHPAWHESSAAVDRSKLRSRTTPA